MTAIDIDENALMPASRSGAQVADNAAMAVRTSEFIITMLPTPDAVREVAQGKGRSLGRDSAPTPCG